MKKPRLTLAEARMFCEVDRHLRLFNPRSNGYGLEQVFSDCHDGGLYTSEVKPLIRKGLLYRVPHERCDRYGDGCLLGQHWTVDLTDRAMQIFWPALYAKRARAVRP